MSTNNFIIAENVNGGNDLPFTQPVTPGFWLDSGVLTFWDGTQNKPVDFNDGNANSRFGTQLPGDI